MTTYVTATIIAQNTWTSTVFFDGDFNFSVSGTFANSAIVTVQRSTDGATWVDVDTFTATGEFVGYEPEPNMRYRAGCKTSIGEYGYATSSIVFLELVATYLASYCLNNLVEVMMATAKEVLIRLEGHEKECTVRYTNIERQLDDGTAKFRKAELMLWSMYPLILGSTFLEKLFQ
jgi:hypothetical protein